MLCLAVASNALLTAVEVFWQFRRCSRPSAVDRHETRPFLRLGRIKRPWDVCMYALGVPVHCSLSPCAIRSTAPHRESTSSPPAVPSISLLLPLGSATLPKRREQGLTHILCPVLICFFPPTVVSTMPTGCFVFVASLQSEIRSPAQPSPAVCTTLKAAGSANPPVTDHPSPYPSSRQSLIHCGLDRWTISHEEKASL